MKYYNFTPSCASKYVSAIAPLNADAAEYSRCDVCGADNLIDWNSFKPVFECETVTSRRTLPDVLLYGGRIIHSFNVWYIVSAEFKIFCDNNSVKGVMFSDVNLVTRNNGKLNSIPERFFLMQITGRAQLDYTKMGVECSICQKCCHYVYSSDYFPLYDPKGIFPALLDETTWDGTDVFNHGDCTEAFMEKVRSSGLKGIDFLPYESKYDIVSNKRYIRV